MTENEQSPREPPRELEPGRARASSEIVFVLLGQGDYERAKSILNRARHPGFVGHKFFVRCVSTGSATVARIDELDVGLALVTKDKLGALSVAEESQGHGVGSALMRHTRPRWVSAITEKQGFFEKLGYRALGATKLNGKHATQLLERTDEAADVAQIEVRPGWRPEWRPPKGERDVAVRRVLEPLPAAWELRVEALQVLRDIMLDDEAAGPCRIAAARSVLDSTAPRPGDDVLLSPSDESVDAHTPTEQELRDALNAAIAVAQYGAKAPT